MYLDLEDYRPDTPRVPSVISVREGVLLSLLLHGLMLMVILFGPTEWFEAAGRARRSRARQQGTAQVRADAAGDRSAGTGEAASGTVGHRSPERDPRTRAGPQNEAPLSRGNTPEKVVGGLPSRPNRPRRPPPSPPAERVPENSAGLYTEARQPSPPTPPAPNVGRALRNLQQYLQDSNYDNALGGATDQNADIQFDAKGADFGPGFVASSHRCGATGSSLKSPSSPGDMSSFSSPSCETARSSTCASCRPARSTR